MLSIMPDTFSDSSNSSYFIIAKYKIMSDFNVFSAVP